MIGVAISTHQRPHILAQALAAWAAHMPDLLIVNHDVNGDGIAATKNRGLAALMDAGCDHLFLVDDDVWPTRAEWWQPYIDSPYPHLQYIRPSDQVKRYDDQHVHRHAPNGVVLYFERHVIERVGGMRTEFGRYGGEHGEHSRRIRNAGFTPVAFIGLADNPFHALDYTADGIESSVSYEERAGGLPNRKYLRRKYLRSDEFVEYR